MLSRIALLPPAYVVQGEGSISFCLSVHQIGGGGYPSYLVPGPFWREPQSSGLRALRGGGDWIPLDGKHYLLGRIELPRQPQRTGYVTGDTSLAVTQDNFLVTEKSVARYTCSVALGRPWCLPSWLCRLFPSSEGKRVVKWSGKERQE